MIDMPYFMKKKEWYEFDPKTKRFVLTDKAPVAARKSLAEFYRSIKKIKK